MKRLSITTTSHGSCVILALAGHLDGNTAPELARQVQQLVAEGMYNLIVDLKEVDFMSSAGLGVFMGEINRVREKQGDIRLLHPNATVRRLIEVMGFTHLFQIFDSEAKVLESFQD